MVGNLSRIPAGGEEFERGDQQEVGNLTAGGGEFNSRWWGI